MNQSDLESLPDQSCKFVGRLCELGFDRTRIHGLFVLLGLYVGAPNTEKEINALFQRLSSVLPIDRSKNIDEVVGHIYDGYDREINEFCYRSGAEFEFREVKVPNVEKSFAIVYLKDEGLLKTHVKSIRKLADASRLYDSFLLALGNSSANKDASLLEAFKCGIFQIQLHAQIDVSGARQISELISSCLPLLYSRCFKSLIGGQLEYFLGLENAQVALLELMQSMQPEYAQQMWAFQSHLFYRDRKFIEGLDKLNLVDWHSWVIGKAQEFDTAYPNQLKPFRSSNVNLTDLPEWGGSVDEFGTCDSYIEEVWGYSADSCRNYFEHLEYMALMVHVVYSALTSARVE